MPSTFFTYASPRPATPFKGPAFLTALASFTLIALNIVLLFTFDDVPPWLRSLTTYAFLPAIIGPIAGIASITTLPLRHHSKQQFAALLLLSLFIFVTPILYVLCSPSNRDREPKWVFIAAQARGIAQSCSIYASDHGGHYPSESAWPMVTAGVDAGALFVYTAADLVDPNPPGAASSSLDPAIIIAYTKPSPLIPDARILAFADGSAERVRTANLPAAFAASNAARAKHRLPPITLDAPPPPPPPPPL